MKVIQILRDLKFAVNSEDHTAKEWQGILAKMQEIGQRANVKMQAHNIKDVEVVEIEKGVEDEKD